MSDQIPILFDFSAGTRLKVEINYLLSFLKKQSTATRKLISMYYTHTLQILN